MARSAADLTVLAIFALAASPASAATGAAVLRRTLSARVAALGGAYAAVPGGLSSLGVNPAGLSAARRPQLDSSFTSGILDDSFGFLGWAQPLPLGTAAAGLSYYDAGTVELVFPGGRMESRAAERDYVGHLGWAGTLPGGLSLGAAAKFFRLELAQEARASGAAADVGAQWRAPLRGLTLGGAIQNLGPGVRFDRDSDPLPRTWRGGACWQWSRVAAAPDPAAAEPNNIRALVSAEAVKTRDERGVGALGGEFGMDFGSTGITLRAGWRLNAPSDGPNLGVGFREGRYQLDYALGDKRALGNVHNVSFGVRF